MAFTLRPYQEAAAQAAIDWIKKCIEPCCMELATGSGKSLIVAHIAQWLNDNTGKRVLCLQPSKELTEQNFLRYTAYGNLASIFSASISKSLRHPVVFGTPQTVKNSITRFTGGEYSLVIIDECHGITQTIKHIISELRKANANLRVIGLSATPYRMNSGYIYQYEPDGKPVPEDMTIEPYFNTCVYHLGANDLIAQGYLTPAHADPDHVASYDTSGLKLNRQGKFDVDAVDRAFVGHGRKTSGIVADIVEHAKDRLGVMIFAATIAHAKEVMASLPFELSALITGATPQDERERIIRDAKAMKIKYLVSVSTLTTGVDIPHVDLIAVLRKTESASLFQQIVGRGLRLSPETNKTDCIAEGQRVLTDRGLIPIEDVRLCDKLWDGTEWVSHDGVIFKGEREVITHDGLTGTPDHKCWTKEGWKTLGELQQSGEPLTKTGNGGSPIFLDNCCGREDYKKGEEQEGIYADRVRRMRKSGGEISSKLAERDGRMQGLRENKEFEQTSSWCSKMASKQVHRCKTKMHKPKRQELYELWWERDKVRVWQPVTNGFMDNGKYTQLVEKPSNRQDRQRQGVCAGKYQNGETFNQYEQSTQELCNENGSRIFNRTSRCEIRSKHANKQNQTGYGLRGNSGAMEMSEPKTKRRVWDIANAGPRNRFTCEGRLVSNCLLLDYAENIEFHQLQDNLFSPVIKTRRKGESEEQEFVCPACSTINTFKLRPNPDEFQITPDGYFADLSGEPVENGEGAQIPAHYGRRCYGQLPSLTVKGTFERCDYRWSVKECPECGHENDIAARFCEGCKLELVDPNENLREEFQRMKADPYTVSTDVVRSFRAQKWISKQGNETLRCDYTTDYASFSVWYSPKMRKQWDDLCIACYGRYIESPDKFVAALAESEIPKTITAYKDRTSKFYRVITHNRPADELPN